MDTKAEREVLRPVIRRALGDQVRLGQGAVDRLVESVAESVAAKFQILPRGRDWQE